MALDFAAELRALAKRIGADHGDLDSEHDRWAVYSRAIRVEEEWPLLLELVRQEPDGPLASTVVVTLLGVLPAARRMDCVEALPVGRSREYASLRARELLVLEGIARGAPGAGGPAPEVSGWSNWLQLRAAESAQDTRVLDALSANGATRRIRHTAKDRFRSLRLPTDHMER
ncbi:hypothetical protein [Nocardiopsis ganjiahuensis]|uniref:hypothetical protein n=1 Tax=Nocardiopsis ganjiahuensis TaxID=239984 RepID=UPI00034DE589|nr:hypothetical protein [Nocardiopsis ganjiahuensis]